MTYAIANIIYGKIVDNKLLRAIRDEVPRESLPDEFLTWLFPKRKSFADVQMRDVYNVLMDGGGIFEFRYSGSADESPRFLGVALCDFDETCSTKLTDLQLSPTAEQYMAARERLEKFPEILRKYFEPFEVWILWGTS